MKNKTCVDCRWYEHNDNCEMYVPYTYIHPNGTGKSILCENHEYLEVMI